MNVCLKRAPVGLRVKQGHTLVAVPLRVPVQSRRPAMMPLAAVSDKASRPHAAGSSDLVYKQRAEKVQAYLERGWKSDVDIPNRFNVLSALLLIAVVAPLLGLGFAMATYGHLWGVITPLVLV